MHPISSLNNTHDLRLPDWGPYTKKYTGTSHIPDIRSGLRFDLSVFPGYYRRQVLIPNAKWESGFHPWEATPDLRYYAYRYELEWKDQVTCDVSFSDVEGLGLPAAARLVRSEFTNRTAQSQNLVLHYMAYLNFPPVRTYSDEAVLPSRVHLPGSSSHRAQGSAQWIDSLDYEDLGYARPRPQDSLVYDGLWRGEVRGHGFVNGCGVGDEFGGDPGDWARYRFHLGIPMAEALLLVRYRAAQGKGSFRLEGCANGVLELQESEAFTLAQVRLGDLAAGSHTFTLISNGGANVELDGFVLVPQALAGEVRFETVEWQPTPEILAGPRPNSLLLKYADVDSYYGLSWQVSPTWELRQLFSDELDRFLRYYVQEHVQKVLVNRQSRDPGHFTNIFIRPVEVPPGQSRVLYGLVCSGSQGEVARTLGDFSLETQDCEAIYQQARRWAFDRSRPLATVRADGDHPTHGESPPEGIHFGERYRFSQERMAATVLTNVVYPVYTRRRYIRHYTPGKWWDCLYTWDAGFIGLGLLELDIDRAVDCLNAYTTPPGDPQAAFLHHGSMVPVQHYLFQELWNRTQERTLLAYFYPRLRQYYRFFAGSHGTCSVSSSTTRRMKSNLLKTWDYFYNSGGWDDYPPQVYVHRNGLEATTTPVISTSHGIRIAKILQMAARAVGEAEDVAEYQADIDAWVTALNRYAWDEQAGYFSYVCHSPEGEPQDFLRHKAGQNYNMGLDGASPFFAGVCTPEQERLILERLTCGQRLWTPYGLCTVDKTADYYRVDGYWNGAVWFPQQWFFWKALLDLGQAAFAAQIAHTALELWKAEVEASYHCFEHFIVQSGRGAGWHQFGGLSTPVLLWYGAYLQPGRLTTGFDAWVHAQQFSENNQRLEADLEFLGGRENCPNQPVVLAAMAPGITYQVTCQTLDCQTKVWQTKVCTIQERYPGLLEITLDGIACGETGRLTQTKVCVQPAAQQG